MTYKQTLTADGETFNATSDHAITADELREWLEHVAGDFESLVQSRGGVVKSLDDWARKVLRV